MNKISTLFAGVVVSAVALGTAQNANAGSMVLGDSGWTASWSNTFDPYIGLAVDYSDGANAVYIEKFVNFTSAFMNNVGFYDPAVITFQPNNATPAAKIVLSDEVLVNSTGSAWTNFVMTILDGATKFDTAASAGFDIAPFTSANYSGGDTVLTLSGGSVADGAVFMPGFPGELVILTDGTNFTLKEQPRIGTGPGPVIPLPAAAWTGLSGLLGLGLLGSLKAIRRMA